jgi:hypothetical protein
MHMGSHTVLLELHASPQPPTGKDAQRRQVRQARTTDAALMSGQPGR